jgi:hypothetical protein
MFKHLIALVLVAFAAAFVSPAVAQQPQGTSVGTLACKMAPSIGLMSASRQVGSWRGAYLHPLQVPGAERLPAPMWVRAARLALVSELAPISCSVEPGVQSPCNHCPSKGRLGSICLLVFQVSHFHWHNDDRAKSIPQPPLRPCNNFDEAARFVTNHQRTFDENHSEIAGQAWIVAVARGFVGWLRFRADGSREGDHVEADGQGDQA